MSDFDKSSLAVRFFLVLEMVRVINYLKKLPSVAKQRLGRNEKLMSKTDQNSNAKDFQEETITKEIKFLVSFGIKFFK